MINFYFSDHEEGVRLGKKLGLDVFCGVEISYKGTDFLIYGLDKNWFLTHSEIQEMKKSDELALMAEHGALIIQAHPFREAAYIDHIRLFPRHVHGIETYNACRSDFENGMAELYAKNYGLFEFAGTDNHRGSKQTLFGGMSSAEPLKNEADFVKRIRLGAMTPFKRSKEC